MYTVITSKNADKDFDRLNKPDQEKTITKLKFIAANPFSSHPNATKIQGEKNTFRLRVGNIRVLYDLDTKSQTLTVWRVKPRSSTYRP